MMDEIMEVLSRMTIKQKENLIAFLRQVEQDERSQEPSSFHQEKD